MFYNKQKIVVLLSKFVLEKTENKTKSRKKRNILSPIEGRSIITNAFEFYEGLVAPDNYGINGQPCTLLVSSVFKLLFVLFNFNKSFI